MRQPVRALELWGGPECTVRRVEDRYLDETVLTGHDHRPDDLELIAALGIRTLRYPLLWERISRQGAADDRWCWSDARLHRLRELGIRPIAGLVHHGSGPPGTSLTDPRFAHGLAAHARAVAERYPWILDYTPVNEPVTTARFSCLYGHWYPHQRDARAFVVAVMTQVRATVLAMAAIRRVQPSARLIQTEDLGFTHSTPLLEYQARLENERRWLSLDLLCGRVDDQHPLWSYLTATLEIPPAELAWFRAHACPPDIIGINHYLSGERYLDERLERYPEASHGGNGTHAYADVLALRVLASGVRGPSGMLRDAWRRYGRPLAITEAHNGSTREEQLRWLADVWDAAHNARAAGCDVRAVTVWSLFGAVGWDRLLTEPLGRYESGVFDVRTGVPRPTALAGMVQQLAQRGRADHPVLQSPGWWRRRSRRWYPRDHDEARMSESPARPLLLLGAGGTLGSAFARSFEARGLSYRPLRRSDVNGTDVDDVARVLRETNAWAVVNAAGYVRVDDAELEPDRCVSDNADLPAALALACRTRGLPLLTFSSDLVFDGLLGRPYVETDPVRPLNVYGASKSQAERRVLDTLPSALVVRTSAFFGPDEANFVTRALASLAQGAIFDAPTHVVVSPTYVPDLVEMALDLMLDGERGLVHLANEDAVSWHELAVRAARKAVVSTRTLRPIEHWPPSLAARPRFSALRSIRVPALPALEDALDRYVCARGMMIGQRSAEIA
jgi:dTDP-4-dehydrorhamnose reductase